jgi:hypothetical protein
VEATFPGVPDEDVEARDAREEFPSLEAPLTGPRIRKFWDEEFDSAKEVLEALARLDACMGALGGELNDHQLQVGIEGREGQEITMPNTLRS